MDKLNTVLYDSALEIVEQDTSTVEAFASLQNYFRAIAPFNTEWIPYAIFHPTNNSNNVGVPAEYLVMANIDTTTINGETYYVYETNFPTAVVGSARATKIDVTLAFIAKAEDLIGVSRYDEDAVGYNDTTYIAAQLLIDYASAVSGNYVRVFNTETDWLFNGTVWTDTDDITVTELEEHRADTVTYALRKGTSTSRPTHAPNNTEAIIAILNTKIGSVEAYNSFYTKVNADLRFVNVTGDVMSGNLNMNNNNIENIKEITIKDETAGQVAKLIYQHTNGNNYQVVKIIYPDGREEEINETFEYNFTNRTDAVLNSGAVLMTDGLTQGNQAVDGYLFSEASEHSMNLVGVVTVDGIADNSKSKATYRGIVHNIELANLYVSGTAYAEGQILYARGGKLSNVAPTKPNRIVRMGTIINVNGTKHDVVLAPLIFQNITELSDSEFTQINGHVPKSDGNKVINFDLDQALEDIDDAKVNRTQTIAGIDLQDNITVVELLSAIGNATESVAGFLSNEDKRRLNLIYLAYGEFPDVDNIVDTIQEMLEVFNNYPEALDLVAILETKLNNDFSALTNKTTMSTTDLFVISDSANGFANKKVTWQQIINQIFIESDAFSASADYKTEGLGANKTAFITRHTMILVTGGIVKADIKAPLVGQIGYFVLPTLVSANKLEMSTDNGVTSIDVLNEGSTIPANTFSELTIKAHYNGTNWIYDTTLARITTAEENIVLIKAGGVNDNSIADAKLVNADGAIKDRVKQAGIVHTLIHDVEGKFYINLSTVILNKTKFTVEFPAMTTNLGKPVEISFDNKVSYANVFVKDVEGNQVYVRDMQSETADVYIDGSNIIINRVKPKETDDIEYNLSIAVQSTVSPVEGSIHGDYKLEGKSAINSFKDGNMDSITTYTSAGTVTITKETPPVEIQGVNAMKAVITIGGWNIQYPLSSLPVIVGKKYLMSGYCYIEVALDVSTTLKSRIGLNEFRFDATLTGQWQKKSVVFTSDGTENLIIQTDGGDDTLGTFYLDALSLIDVTKDSLAGLTDAQIISNYSTYFEGLKSIVNPEIKVTNKNVFDETTKIGGGFASSTGVYSDIYDTNYCNLDFISLIDGKDYVLSVGVSGEKQIYYYIDNVDTSFIGRQVSATGDEVVLVIPTGAKYCRIMYLKINETAQLEVGTVASNYLAHASSSKKYPLQTLRSVGDIADYIDTKNDDLHNLVGYDFNDVLKDAITWTVTADTTTTRFRKDLSGVIDYVSAVSGGVPANCLLKIGDKTFINTDSGSVTSNDIDGIFAIDDVGRLAIKVFTTTASTTGEFEAYLQANDVTFQYELDTPPPALSIDSDGIALAYENMTIELIQDNGFSFSMFAKHSLDIASTVPKLANGLAKLHKQLSKVEAKTDLGWSDLLGEPKVLTVGANDPSFAVYRGSLRQFKYATNAMNELYFSYHIPHGYVMNSDMFIHVHWSTAIIDSGNAKWYFEISYAKGYGQDEFTAPIVVSVIQQGSSVAYSHLIAEVQFTDDGTSKIDKALLEPDGLILVRMYRDPADGSDTLTQAPFVHYVDIHLQVDKIATPNRNYPFE